MRKIFASIATATLLMLSVPAGAEIAVTWQCSLADGKTNDDLVALTDSWVAAAQDIDESIRVSIYYPMAGDAELGTFIWVMYIDSATAWGKFVDSYEGTAAYDIDEGWDDIAPCAKAPNMWDVAEHG